MLDKLGTPAMFVPTCAFAVFVTFREPYQVVSYI